MGFSHNTGRAGTIHQYIDRSRSGSPRYNTDFSIVSIFHCESGLLDQSCELVCVIYKTSPGKYYNTKWSEVARHPPLSRMSKIREVSGWHKTNQPILKPVFSSPEHEVLMVRYCGQSMSVVRRPSCGVNNCFNSLLLLHPWANWLDTFVLGRKHRGDL